MLQLAVWRLSRLAGLLSLEQGVWQMPAAGGRRRQPGRAGRLDLAFGRLGTGRTALHTAFCPLGSNYAAW